MSYNYNRDRFQLRQSHLHNFFASCWNIFGAISSRVFAASITDRLACSDCDKWNYQIMSPAQSRSRLQAPAGTRFFSFAPTYNGNLKRSRKMLNFHIGTEQLNVFFHSHVAMFNNKTRITLHENIESWFGKFSEKSISTVASINESSLKIFTPGETPENEAR